MNIIQTKKNEVVSTIFTYAELSRVSGMFINKTICKGWKEDFVDESTGEVVSIERKQVLYDKGTEITPDLVSSLLFNFECGEIKEVEISNQRRSAYETSYGTRIYLAVAEVGPKAKKYKFLFSASSIPVSIEILKDYIELNFLTGYRIISLKEFQTDVILDDNLKKEGDISSEEDAMNEDKFYQITALVQNEDGYEYNANAVVRTTDLDKAIILLNRRLADKAGDEKFTTKLEEAKLINVDHIIEDEFTAAYKPV